MKWLIQSEENQTINQTTIPTNPFMENSDFSPHLHHTVFHIDVIPPQTFKLFKLKSVQQGREVLCKTL